MDRDTAVRLAQQAIKARNKRLVEKVLELRTARGERSTADLPLAERPLIAVTCSTGWECYAVVDELVKTRKFRVRALYRTPGTQAAERLERLLQRTENEQPGLLTIRPGVDMTSAEKLTDAFRDCDGVVLYLTANEARAGKITNHGNDPAGGRAAFMRQVSASLAALKANRSVKQVITLVFPTDKVTGIADDYPEIPWWIDQRLRFSDLLRGEGINVCTLHRPAYYYGLHRVDYTTNEVQARGNTAMSKNMIKENNMPGINHPDFMVNWVDVRDIGKWCGTIFEYPEVFANERLSIASCAMTGNQAVEIAERTNRHGTKFKYRIFPQWVMKMVSLFTEEVVYPLRYSQWYNDRGNAYDFASNDDLADLERIHPRWTFEAKLESWGITEIRPGEK